MRHDIQSVLDECLKALAAGESLEAVLARYPEQAAELRPLLLASHQVRGVPIARPRSHVQQAGWQRFLGEAIALERVHQRPTFSLWRPLRPLAMAASLLLVPFLAGGVTIYAASGSQPDSPLYGIKLATEEARLWFAFDENERANILLGQAETRLGEMNTMIEQGKPVKGNVLSAMRGRMDRAANIIDRQDAPPDLVERANALSARQEEILITFQDQVPLDARSEYGETLAVVHEIQIRIVVRQAEQAPAIDSQFLAAGVSQLAGQIDAREGNAWIIGGQPVLVDEATIVRGEGEVAPGQMAYVSVVHVPDQGYRAITIVLPATLDLANTVRMSGWVDKVEGNTIEVGGRTVTLGEETLQEGQLREGSMIELTGESANKTFMAKTIYITSPEEERAAFAYEGTVQEIGLTQWTVGSHTFQVSPSTPVDAGLVALRAGARARVEAVQQGTTFVAKRIILLSAAESPQAVAVEGIFQGEADGRWLVGGMDIAVSGDVPQTPPIGALVRIAGLEKDQTIVVSQAEPIRQPDQTGLLRLEGLMTQLGEEAWLVGPTRIRITDDTKVGGQLISGARAVVWAQTAQGDALDALYVDVLDAQSLLGAQSPQLTAPLQ